MWLPRRFSGLVAAIRALPFSILVFSFPWLFSLSNFLLSFYLPFVKNPLVYIHTSHMIYYYYYC